MTTTKPKPIKSLRSDQLVELAAKSPEDETKVKDELLRRAQSKAVQIRARTAGPTPGIRPPSEIGRT